MFITKDIQYVGVNDHQVDLFEGHYIVPEGMAYNSYVMMTSGQWTIGAATKLRVCVPSSRVSPSLTAILLSAKSSPSKKFAIMLNAFCDDTMVV